MTQVMPDVDRRSAEGRPEANASAPVVPYAAPDMNIDAGGRLAVAGLTCGVLFFVQVVIAAVVHPKIEAALLFLLIATPLAAVLLGSVAGQRAKKVGSKPRRSARAAVWLGGGELALVLAFGIMIPSMCRATEPANRFHCQYNLQRVGVALLNDATEHDGHFPDTLNELLAPDPAYLVTDLFTCPSSSDERALGQTPEEQARNLTAEPGHLSYIYVGAGLTKTTATADRVVAYDKPHNHNNEGINVLYGDAHTEFLDRKQAEQLIAKFRAAAPVLATRRPVQTLDCQPLIRGNFRRKPGTSAT